MSLGKGAKRKRSSIDQNENNKHRPRERLKALLRFPTFVDYFNVFLNLPVFGQRVLFQLQSKKFIFSPHVSANIDKHRVLDWLIEERYNLFRKTRLAHEYRLSCQLQKVKLSFRFNDTDQDATAASELLGNFCCNLIGNTAGMYLFREFLRGTCGARVIACWMHVQAFREARDPERRWELFNAIRRHYLHPVIVPSDPACLQDIVAQDIFNFHVVPPSQRTMASSSRVELGGISTGELDPHSPDALSHVQQVLLTALQSYWLPCYVFHVLASQGMAILKKLFQKNLHDEVDEEMIRRLMGRCTIFNVEKDAGAERPSSSVPSRKPSLSSVNSTSSESVLPLSTRGSEVFSSFTLTSELSASGQSISSGHNSSCAETVPAAGEDSVDQQSSNEDNVDQQSSNEDNVDQQSPNEDNVDQSSNCYVAAVSSETGESASNINNHRITGSLDSLFEAQQFLVTYNYGHSDVDDLEAIEDTSDADILSETSTLQLPEVPNVQRGQSSNKIRSYDLPAELSRSSSGTEELSASRSSRSGRDLSEDPDNRFVADTPDMNYKTDSTTHQSQSSERTRQLDDGSDAEAIYSSHLLDQPSEDTINVYKSTPRAQTDPIYSKTDPTCSKTDPACSKTNPTCSKTDPTCSKTDPICSKTDPTCSKTGPTCSKTDPICSKTDPTCSKTNSTCSKTDPTCSKTDPSCSKADPICSKTDPTCSKTGPTCSKTDSICSKTDPACSKADPTCSKTGPTCSKTDPTCSKTGPICSKTGPTCSKTDSICSKTEPACSKADPTCSKTGPTCSKTDPICSKTDPTCSKTDPTCSKTHPTCSKTDPTYKTGPFCSKIDPTCSKTGPTCNKTDPICSKTDPTCSKADPTCSKTDQTCSKTDPTFSKTDPTCSKTDPICSKTYPTTSKNIKSIKHAQDDNCSSKGGARNFAKFSRYTHRRFQRHSKSKESASSDDEETKMKNHGADIIVPSTAVTTRSLSEVSENKSVSFWLPESPEDNDLTQELHATTRGRSNSMDSPKYGPRAPAPSRVSFASQSLESNVVKSRSRLSSLELTSYAADVAGSSNGLFTKDRISDTSSEDHCRERMRFSSNRSPHYESSKITIHDSERINSSRLSDIPDSPLYCSYSADNFVCSASNSVLSCSSYSIFSEPHPADSCLFPSITSDTDTDLDRNSSHHRMPREWHCTYKVHAKQNVSQISVLSMSEFSEGSEPHTSTGTKRKREVRLPCDIVSSFSEINYSYSSSNEVLSTDSKEANNNAGTKHDVRRLEIPEHEGCNVTETDSWATINEEEEERIKACHQGDSKVEDKIAKMKQKLTVTAQKPQKVTRKQEWVNNLTSLLIHFMFGTRDIKKEEPKSDRRMLCLLACDATAGSPLRKHLSARCQKIYKYYLDFWAAMRRYLQLRDFCHMEVASPEKGAEMARLVEQQAHHLARTFLTDSGHRASIFSDKVKLQILQDLFNKRQSTLINATQDVVSSVLNIPATQFLLRDLQVFHDKVGLTNSFSNGKNGSPRQRSGRLDPWCDDSQAARFITIREGMQGMQVKRDHGVDGQTLSEKHRLQAFQFLIMISEDLHTSVLCEMEDLTEMIWSELGSLYIRSHPRARNPFLRKRLPFKRLSPNEIACLSQITQAYLNMKSVVRKGITFDKLIYLQKRRIGVEISLPRMPRRFAEVLYDQQQFVAFWLFLNAKGKADSLSFWKACDDIQKETDPFEKKLLLDILRDKYLLGPKHANLLISPDYVQLVGSNPNLSPHHLSTVQYMVSSHIEKNWWGEYQQNWTAANAPNQDPWLPSSDLGDYEELEESGKKSSFYRHSVWEVTPFKASVTGRRMPYSGIIGRKLRPTYHMIIAILRLQRARRRRIQERFKKFAEDAMISMKDKPRGGMPLIKIPLPDGLGRLSVIGDVTEYKGATPGPELQITKLKMFTIKRFFQWRQMFITLKSFLLFMRSPRDCRQFEAFLSSELDNAKAARERNIMVEGHIECSYIRTLNKKTYVVNKLVNDLRCWIIADKYKMLALEMSQSKSKLFTKLCALQKLAKTIIHNYLDSVERPTVQINISQPDATHIVSMFNAEGTDIHLFHNIIALLTPILAHYWKKFTGGISDKPPETERLLKPGKKKTELSPTPSEEPMHKELAEPTRVTPHPDQSTQDYQQITVEDYKVQYVDKKVPIGVSRDSDEIDTSKADKAGHVHFSLGGGVYMKLSEQSKKQKEKEEKERAEREEKAEQEKTRERKRSRKEKPGQPALESAKVEPEVRAERETELKVVARKEPELKARTGREPEPKVKAIKMSELRARKESEPEVRTRKMTPDVMAGKELEPDVRAGRMSESKARKEPEQEVKAGRETESEVKTRKGSDIRAKKEPSGWKEMQKIPTIDVKDMETKTFEGLGKIASVPEVKKPDDGKASKVRDEKPIATTASKPPVRLKKKVAALPKIPVSLKESKNLLLDELEREMSRTRIVEKKARQPEPRRRKKLSPLATMNEPMEPEYVSLSPFQQDPRFPFLSQLNRAIEDYQPPASLITTPKLSSARLRTGSIFQGGPKQSVIPSDAHDLAKYMKGSHLSMPDLRLKMTSKSAESLMLGFETKAKEKRPLRKSTVQGPQAPLAVDDAVKRPLRKSTVQGPQAPLAVDDAVKRPLRKFTVQAVQAPADVDNAVNLNIVIEHAHKISVVNAEKLLATSSKERMTKMKEFLSKSKENLRKISQRKHKESFIKGREREDSFVKSKVQEERVLKSKMQEEIARKGKMQWESALKIKPQEESVLKSREHRESFLQRKLLEEFTLKRKVQEEIVRKRKLQEESLRKVKVGKVLQSKRKSVSRKDTLKAKWRKDSNKKGFGESAFGKARRRWRLNVIRKILFHQKMVLTKNEQDSLNAIKVNLKTISQHQLVESSKESGKQRRSSMQKKTLFKLSSFLKIPLDHLLTEKESQTITEELKKLAKNSKSNPELSNILKETLSKMTFTSVKEQKAKDELEGSSRRRKLKSTEYEKSEYRLSDKLNVLTKKTKIELADIGETVPPPEKEKRTKPQYKLTVPKKVRSKLLGAITKEKKAQVLARKQSVKEAKKAKRLLMGNLHRTLSKFLPERFAITPPVTPRAPTVPAIKEEAAEKERKRPAKKETTKAKREVSAEGKQRPGRLPPVSWKVDRKRPVEVPQARREKADVPQTALPRLPLKGKASPPKMDKTGRLKDGGIKIPTRLLEIQQKSWVKLTDLGEGASPSPAMVSAQVELLNMQRASGDAVVVRELETVKNYKKAIDRLYAEKAGKPHVSSLLALKMEESEALSRRERQGDGSRPMVVDAEVGRTPPVRVTTPDIAETQKQRKQKRSKEVI